MTLLDTYFKQVLPNLPEKIQRQVESAYPSASFRKKPTYEPLSQQQVIMLVGLTGTGKSTTIAALNNTINDLAATYIPTRRELTEWILIPLAQHSLGHELKPVRDREQRFFYTRTFRDVVAEGGAATIFGWLYSQPTQQWILSEGIRGTTEIEWALANTRWHIVELWADPVERLRRLTNRHDALDVVTNDDTTDLEFLPETQHEEVRTLLANRDISPTAIVTARAEFLNYGGLPYDSSNQTNRYLCVDITTTTPQQVAQKISSQILNL